MENFKLEQALNTIKHFVETKELMTSTFEKCIKDKTIPQSERWEMFLLAGKNGLIPTEDFIQHFEGDLAEWLENDILNGEMVEKHRVFSAEDCLMYAKDDEKSEEFINDLKEQWMDKFVYSFKFNW